MAGQCDFLVSHSGTWGEKRFRWGNGVWIFLMFRFTQGRIR
jgi:hypothetical protein